MSNVGRLGKISVSLEPDEEGYLGRECPVESCLGYFKITPGTGVKGPAPCHCPYCGHTGEQRTFTTPAQNAYVESVVLRHVTDAIHKDLKKLEFEHKPRGGFGIGISMKVTRSAPHPIRYYREEELETEVVCEQCTLRFAIYGVFGWCPDCGAHNSLQILSKNLELARKELNLVATVEPDLAEHLTGDALENVVSAFDGFGREVCLQRSSDIRFQSLSGARRRVQEVFGFDFADGLSPDEWANAVRVFQKRHLLAHKMGVIDSDYAQKANDPGVIIGRKVRIATDEVSGALRLVEVMAQRLFKGLLAGTQAGP